MNTKILTIALAGFLFCGITSCNNNTEVVDNSTDKVEVTESNEVESDPTVMEAASETDVTEAADLEGDGKVKQIDTKYFIAEIFDYKANPTKWVYKGSKPAIIDFYATWCGPCKKVAPIMDELAEKYKGEVNFYKIDTDQEKELAGSVFGIRSIPSILYIPVDGQPMMSTGLYPKEEYIKQIETSLLKK
jgi:thioredoxin